MNPFDTLRHVTTATITTMLLKKGIRHCWMKGAMPLVRAGSGWSARPSRCASCRCARISPPRKLGQADLDPRGDRGDAGRLHRRRRRDGRHHRGHLRRHPGDADGASGVTALVTDGVIRDKAGVLDSQSADLLPGHRGAGLGQRADIRRLERADRVRRLRDLSGRRDRRRRRRRGGDPARTWSISSPTKARSTSATRAGWSARSSAAWRCPASIRRTTRPRRATRPNGRRRATPRQTSERRCSSCLSKILGFLTVPSNIILRAGVVGMLLLVTRFRARRAVGWCWAWC